MTVSKVLTNGADKPFDVLGMSVGAKTTEFAVYLPDAEKVDIVCAKTGRAIIRIAEANNGLFRARVSSALMQFDQDFVYRVEAHYEGVAHSYIDPYQFVEEAYHAVHFIDHAPENLYRQAGAQLRTYRGVSGVSFAVYAPSASAVSLIGDFNYWHTHSHPMQKTDLGYWVLFVPELSAGETYKYAIVDGDGKRLPDKQDPIGFHHHQYPSHCSLVYDHQAYKWQDSEWQKRKVNHYQSAMSIYEVHLGSWRRASDNAQDYLSYQQLVDELIPYVKYMAYTHIEVLPVSEFPFDGSWGYQPVGLFAPTSRFGDPDGFKYFVDQCHQNGIGVIIDWVPAHFPEDGHGLARFDGTHLYEYEDPRKGWHPDWNSCIYDFGKDSVRQFLVANALFWFDHYHIDGIRVDAVASMLYLDYSRKDGEWIPNVDGGNHNYEAISLLRWMNTEVYAKHPNAVTIAEESTSFPGVSKPVDQGGLGFGFKWNMGWMHDSLHYIAKDPAYRRFHHGEITFSMVYAFDENFVLPISHDEVVHGKGAMLQKMPGDEWQQAANLRAYYGFMFAHPGKKLQFMGNAFAQAKEWNHDQSLDWHLTNPEGQGKHAQIQALYRALNTLYADLPALHDNDHDAQSFTWIDHSNAEHSVLSFMRKSNTSAQQVLVVCNFTPLPRSAYRIGVSTLGAFQLCMNTDAAKFGGSDLSVKDCVEAEQVSMHNQAQSVMLDLPPLSTMIYVIGQ